MIAELMKQLKKEYVETLPEKHDRIQSLFQKNLRDDIETEFHKMKGTGKTYGLGEISILGELIEALTMEPTVPLKDFIPSALILLNEIYKTRQSDQAYELEQSEVFQKLMTFRKGK